MTSKTNSEESRYAARRRAALKAAGLAVGKAVGAFLVTKVEDVAYLSGFTGEDSFLLVLDGYACLLTDGRYGEQAAYECPGVEILVRKGPMAQAIADVLKTHRVRTMAFQADHLTIHWRQEVMAKTLLKVKLYSSLGVPSNQRQVKDAGEIVMIRKAIRAAEQAFMAMLSQGKKAFVGRTERQVAAELDYRMRLAGADKSSFDTIVAFGPHASLPHYRPGDTVIENNNVLLIDWGAFVGGYCSDLTRVVLIGKIPPKLASVYEVVRRAQERGIAAIRAGTSFKSADGAARKVIADAGYGLEFVHSLGHGIGRQIHEMPGLSQQAPGRLKRGMIVTVEPGIYLPGVGGVRIEDDVLVGPDGPQRLSSLSTAIAAMTLR